MKLDCDLSDDDFQPVSSRASQAARAEKRPVKRSRVDKGSNSGSLCSDRLHQTRVQVSFRAPGCSKTNSQILRQVSIAGDDLRESLADMTSEAGSSRNLPGTEVGSPITSSKSQDTEEEQGLGTQMHVLLSLCKNAIEHEGDDDIAEMITQVGRSQTQDVLQDTAHGHSSVDRLQKVLQGTAQDHSSVDRSQEVLQDTTQGHSFRKVTALQDITNTVPVPSTSGGPAECVNEDVYCPVCSAVISTLSIKEREDHSNACLDNGAHHPKRAAAVDTGPVVEFLERLNLSRYAPIFIKEEIDWDTLQWLTEEDLSNLGVETFGPRKKILSAVKELRNVTVTAHSCKDAPEDNQVPQSSSIKKYITDFFAPPATTRIPKPGPVKQKDGPHKDTKQTRPRKEPRKAAELRQWMKIPGTKFRVDAFKHLSTECSHWFLTHFHSDHYQGLTKGFRYGKIYCSMITARLVNLRIGIPWDRLHPLDFGSRTEVDGAWVTLLDANHCPGAAMIFFETPNGKVVLHTGDFRFCEEMTEVIGRLPKRIETLILDTTYCNPQYDFPKQESIIQFVIDAIQAESFNPKTLFLIGTYSLGKERLFMEVARVLRQKIYVGAVKRKMLACIELSKEDMDLITTNDWETNIHVVPLWSIASFKRMTSISRHYHGKFNTIVSFSPTGWSFGRGKKRSNGRRAQQGTVIRYEVPYSEHSSFTELKQFVKVVAPLQVIPSVNNTSSHAAESMVKSLLS